MHDKLDKQKVQNKIVAEKYAKHIYKYLHE